MKKFLRFFVLNLIMAVLFSTTVFADDRYFWNEPPEYDLIVKHILTAFDDEANIHRNLIPTNNEERMIHWSYSIFYCPAIFKGNKLFLTEGSSGYLVFLSHGSYGRNGYQLVINGRGYSDYAYAVDTILNYFRNAGYFNGLDYSYVLVNTCYPGYMNYENYLPQMKMYMKRAINHQNVTGHYWYNDNNGNLRLQLYKGYPLYNQGVESTSAARNGKTEIIHYKGKTLIIGK